MVYTRNNVLILLPASDNSKEMKYGRAAFWIFTFIIIFQAIAPINGTNSKLNNNYILSVRLDYLVHVAMFAGLAVLFRLAYFPRSGITFSREVLFFGAMLLTAFFSEAVQWFVPYRVFNINDLAANVCGVLLSIPLIRQGRILFKRKYLPSGSN